MASCAKAATRSWTGSDIRKSTNLREASASRQLLRESRRWSSVAALMTYDNMAVELGSLIRR